MTRDIRVPSVGTMPKRSREEDVDAIRSVKRLRTNHPDRLSLLSDELLLRTLSHLPVPDLARCQRCAYRAYDKALS